MRFQNTKYVWINRRLKFARTVIVSEWPHVAVDLDKDGRAIGVEHIAPVADNPLGVRPTSTRAKNAPAVMADGATISISTVVWEKKVIEYAAKTGLGIKEAIAEEWPLLLRKVMDFTPPFKTKGKPGASDLSVGRAAVAFDIYKTMRPFDPANIRSKSLKKIVDQKDIAAFNAFAANSKSPLLRGATAVAFSPNEHLRQRDRRGRVTGRSRNKVVLGTDVALLKRYVAKVQAKVGYAKSGWLKALLAVGGKAPSYVTKQGTGGGEVIDKRDDPDNPSITAINQTPWAVRKDEGERILADAKASRINAIISKIRTKERLARKAAKLAA